MSDPRKAPMTETATPTDDAPTTTEAVASSDGQATNGRAPADAPGRPEGSVDGATAEAPIAEPLPFRGDHGQAPIPVMAPEPGAPAPADAVAARA